MKKRIVMIFLVFFSAILLFGCGVKQVELPNLNNSNKAQTIAKMNEVGLKFIVADEVNNKVQEGLFSRYDEDLKAGDKVKKDKEITIYFAYHKNILPDLTGLNKTEILKEFEYVKFQVTYKEVETDEVTPNEFLSYEVFEAGTELPEGTRVTVNIGITPFPEKHQVLISKYYEGKDNNNAIEIYNSSDTTIDLNLFEIGIYENGSMTPTTRIPLEGVELQAGKTYLIVDAVNEDLKAKADLTITLPYVGKEAVALLYKDMVVDVVGNIGQSLLIIHDVALIRRSHITENKDTYNVLEWDKYVPDFYEIIGSHPVEFPTSFEITNNWLELDYFTTPGGVVEGQYTHTADGDTSYFNPHFTGSKRVRYVGVNTPEMSSSDPRELRLAQAATNFTADKLSNATKTLIQNDKSTGITDTYGRYLGLIWYDGKLLNYELVLNGHSQNNYYDSENFFVYKGVTLNYWFERAEQHAKENQLGIWGP